MECQICFDTISCSEENKEDKCPENISDKTNYFISCNICQNHYHSECYKLWVSEYKKSPSANKQIKCIMCTNKNCLVKTYFNHCNISKVDSIDSHLVLTDLDLGEEPFTTVDIPNLNTSDIVGNLNFVDEIEYLDRYLQNINQNNDLIYESVGDDHVDDVDDDDVDDVDEDEQSVERRDRRVRGRANGSRDQRRIWVHEEYRYRNRNNDGNGCCVIS